MSSYWDKYDDPPGERRSILRKRRFSFEERPFDTEQERIRIQAETIIEQEIAEEERREALIASGVVHRSGRLVKKEKAA